MEWRYLAIDDKPMFDAALKRFPINLSDYTFTNLWMWSGWRHYEWTESNDCLAIRFYEDNVCKYLCPIGHEGRRELLTTLAQHYAPIQIRAIPESVLSIFEGLPYQIHVEEDRYDYIFSFDDLLH